MRRQSSLFVSVSLVFLLLTAGVQAQQLATSSAFEPVSDVQYEDQYNPCGSDCNGETNCGVCGNRVRLRDGRCDRCGGGGCGQGCQQQCNVGRSYFVDQGQCGSSREDNCKLTGYDPCCRRGPFYFSGFGGYASVDNFVRKLDIDEGDPNLQTVEKLGPTVLDGWATGASIGRYIHPQGRTELEFTYRDNGIGDVFRQRFEDKVLVFQSSQDADGRIDSYSAMFNILFDLEPRQVGCAQLYGGGGIGVLFVDGQFSTGPVVVPPTDFVVSDAGFAYQGIVGINYAFRPRIDIYTEYRYLGSQTISVEDITNNLLLGNFQVDTHSVFFGIRIFK